MKVKSLAIADVLLIEPTVYGDDRGFFFESFNQAQFNALVGQDLTFVQDNHSKSARGVLRGLHYQIKQPQGKLVRVVDGEVFDVAVDLRKASPTFGKWVGKPCRLTTNGNCGFRPVSPTAFLCSPSRRSSSTRPRISIRRRTSEQLFGMTPR